MVELLGKLLALYGTLKNLHYSASGIAFYSVHTMADEMCKNILDYIDEIQENNFLGNGLPAVNFDVISQIASDESVSGTVDECLRGSLALITNILEIMEEQKSTSVEDIFSRLSNELYKNKGFVLKTLS